MMIPLLRKNLASNYHVKAWRSPFPLQFFSTQLGVINSTTIFDMLRNNYEFPHELASRVASELTRLKTLEKADSILTFFKASGFSNAQLQGIIKYRPSFLCFSLENIIKPKIKVFQDEGFSSDDISKIISSNPKILQLSLNNTIIPSLSVMKGLLGPTIDVARVVRRSTWLLNGNMEKTVVANVEFLKSCGVPMDRVRIVFKSSPTAFGLKPQVIRACVEKAEEMGLTAASKAFIYAIPTIASMSNKSWELKLQAFRDMGFSDSDVLNMFRKVPSVFAISSRKIKKITEALFATGKFDISSIVHLPGSLRYSFEQRYKPRLRILRLLESRELIANWPSLQTICNFTDDEFFEEFVRPYLDEVSHVYFRNRSAR